MPADGAKSARKRRIAGTIFFYLAITAILVFLFILFASAENVDNVPGTDDVSVVALIAIVWMAVTAIALVVLIILGLSEDDSRMEDHNERLFGEREMEWYVDEHPRADRSSAAIADVVQEPNRKFRTTAERHVPGGQLRGNEVVAHNLVYIPVDTRAWSGKGRDAQGDVYSFHFPRDADGALWANDYIPIDKFGSRLRLRTLLAAPRDAFDRPSSRPMGARSGAVRPVATLAARETAGTAQVMAPPAKAKPKPKQDLYYDYPGDVHPVIDVEGIGDVYARKLERIGVKTTARLCYEDAGTLALSLSCPKKTVELWQVNAELMKISGVGKQYAEAMARAGIGGIQELKQRSPQALADQINSYLDGLKTNVLGNPVTAKRVEGWQKAAKPMRRVRSKIPEE